MISQDQAGILRKAIAAQLALAREELDKVIDALTDRRDSPVVSVTGTKLINAENVEPGHIIVAEEDSYLVVSVIDTQRTVSLVLRSQKTNKNIRSTFKHGEFLRITV